MTNWLIPSDRCMARLVLACFLIVGVVAPSTVRAQGSAVRPIAAVGGMFGFPLTGASGVPATVLTLGLEGGPVDGGGAGRVVIEGVLHPRVVPGERGVTDPITRLVGGGVDLRVPLRTARGSEGLMLGIRSYVASEEVGGPFLLTMPRVTYAIGVRRDAVSADLEIGVQYLAFTNASANWSFTRFLFPFGLTFRF
jgi:hypothetical protein